MANYDTFILKMQEIHQNWKFPFYQGKMFAILQR